MTADGALGWFGVPEVVRRRALAVGATQWLGELSALIARLEQDWSITVGRPFDGATEAFVAEATLADDTRAVLKLIVPGPANAATNEITALRLANGEGCVRLLREDAPRGALLLERLGRSLQELAPPAARGGRHTPTAARSQPRCRR